MRKMILLTLVLATACAPGPMKRRPGSNIVLPSHPQGAVYKTSTGKTCAIIPIGGVAVSVGDGVSCLTSALTDNLDRPGVIRPPLR